MFWLILNGVTINNNFVVFLLLIDVGLMCHPQAYLKLMVDSTISFAWFKITLILYLMLPLSLSSIWNRPTQLPFSLVIGCPFQINAWTFNSCGTCRPEMIILNAIKQFQELKMFLEQSEACWLHLMQQRCIFSAERCLQAFPLGYLESRVEAQ